MAHGLTPISRSSPSYCGRVPSNGGIREFKVATLCYAWDNAYGEVAPFAKRHPEAWTHWGAAGGDDPTVNLNSYFDPGKTLHTDEGKFAALPKGIPEGTAVHTAFTAQWGALSKSVGLDGIMLRDSFGFPVPYARSGPLGPVMPSAEAIHRATADVAMMVREMKQANPSALTMMYSNAASAISDWRSNGLDLESVANGRLPRHLRRPDLGRRMERSGRSSR